MFEIQSCGVTLDILNSHEQAQRIFEQSQGAEVKLFRYSGNGSKKVIASKTNNLKVASSFKPRSIKS